MTISLATPPIWEILKEPFNVRWTTTDPEKREARNVAVPGLHD
jgi:hypothetical protein